MEKNFFVPMTKEQMVEHDEYYDNVCKLVNKWRKHKYLSEQDRQRLLIFLNCMRMGSDSTFILDQKTRHDTKIAELMIILDEIFENKTEKIVIFSQWERMTRLIAHELNIRNIKYEYLHGGVPGNKRKDLLDNFHNDSNSKVFLSTDAGGVGLNLQCASTVINMDIPWNPAVLEQRIARVHRLGQKNHVRVLNFVSTGTIEEKILSLIGFKKSVFEGVFDKGDNEVFMGEDRFKQFMRTVETITETSVEDMEPVLMEDEYNNEKEISEIQSIPKELTSYTPTEEVLDKSFKKKESQPGQSASSENQLSDLFVSGLNFLEQLGNTLQHIKTGKTSINNFIEKDVTTGKPYLKIPVPDEKIVEQALTTIGSFLELLKPKK